MAGWPRPPRRCAGPRVSSPASSSDVRTAETVCGASPVNRAISALDTPGVRAITRDTARILLCLTPAGCIPRAATAKYPRARSTLSSMIAPRSDQRLKKAPEHGAVHSRNDSLLAEFYRRGKALPAVRDGSSQHAAKQDRRSNLPVGRCPVSPLQVWSLLEPEAFLCHQLFVDLDAKARRVAHRIARPVQLGLDREVHGVVEAQFLVLRRPRLK